MVPLLSLTWIPMGLWVYEVTGAERGGGGGGVERRRWKKERKEGMERELEGHCCRTGAGQRVGEQRE